MKAVKVKSEELRIKKAKAEGRMKRVTLCRAGYGNPSDVEVADLAKGRFHVCDRVAIAVRGDCGMKRSAYRDYMVTRVDPCNRWGGTRETVTFRRVKKGGAK